MMKFFFIVGLIALVGCSYFSEPSTKVIQAEGDAVLDTVVVSEQKNDAALFFEPQYYSFGQVEKGPVVTKVFKFKNNSNKPVAIVGHGVTCGCTMPSYEKDRMYKPGEEGELSVGFNTGVKSVGSYKKRVSLKTNQGEFFLGFEIEVIENKSNK